MPLKWMIWGYPYFRRPPYVSVLQLIEVDSFMLIDYKWHIGKWLKNIVSCHEALPRKKADQKCNRGFTQKWDRLTRYNTYVYTCICLLIYSSKCIYIYIYPIIIIFSHIIYHLCKYIIYIYIYIILYIRCIHLIYTILH